MTDTCTCFPRSNIRIESTAPSQLSLQSANQVENSKRAFDASAAAPRAKVDIGHVLQLSRDVARRDKSANSDVGSKMSRSGLSAWPKRAMNKTRLQY